MNHERRGTCIFTSAAILLLSACSDPNLISEDSEGMARIEISRSCIGSNCEQGLLRNLRPDKTIGVVVEIEIFDRGKVEQGKPIKWSSKGKGQRGLIVNPSDSVCLGCIFLGSQDQFIGSAQRIEYSILSAKEVAPANAVQGSRVESNSGLVGDSVIDDNTITAAILDTYIGTLGDKQFKLVLERVDSGVITGYNVAGMNRRPVQGKVVSWSTKPTGAGGGEYRIYELVLKEPGDHEWDGEFNVELWLSDLTRHGNGSWHSYDGKLNRTIVIRDPLAN